MNGYLLDTNICISAFRNEHGIVQRMRQIGKDSFYVSDVTVLELKYGAYKSQKTEENLKTVNNFLGSVKIVPFADAVELFCEEKVRLQKLGTPLEDYDLLIGCSAKAKGLVMVTHNVKHLERIEGIVIEDWVRQ